MNNKSFTLIELLVVIVIIGILAGVIMISTSSSIDKASFARGKAFSSTVRNELLSNLLSEWTFDNSSNRGEDSWGNNDGAVLAGSPTFLTGLAEGECIFGGCVSFDGDDNINLVEDSLNNVSDWTISFFVKANNAGYIYTEGTQAATLKIVVNPNGSMYLSTWNLDHPGNWLTATSNVIISDTSEWNYVALSLKDGGVSTGDLKYYINGQLKDTKVSQKEYHVSTRYAMLGDNIGAYDSTPQGHVYFNGSLDEFRIYDIALSSSQIKQNYIAGLNSLLGNGNISKEEYNERINALAYE